MPDYWLNHLEVPENLQFDAHWKKARSLVVDFTPELGSAAALGLRACIHV